MLKVLLIDDHALIRKGLMKILLEEFPSADIDEASSAEDVTKLVIRKDYDIIISDLNMPGRNGLEVVEYLKRYFPKTPVLVLSMQPEEQYAIRALKTGAAGFLSKDTATDELIKAVQMVLQGRRYVSSSLSENLLESLNNVSDKPLHELLSNREFHVFRLLAEGKSVSMIAKQLTLSVTTISTFRSRIIGKMNLKTNADFTKYCIRENLM